MTELNVTEADTVQLPMVRHAAEVGWTPLSPPVALAYRGGTAGTLLREVVTSYPFLHKSYPSD